MKKHFPYIIGLFLVMVSTSYVVIQAYTKETFLDKIVKETPPNKLPLFVILSNMDVKGWSLKTPDSAKFYHQYKIITNADHPRRMKVTTTGFIEVSKETFLENYRHLDMEIRSKVKTKGEIKIGKIAAPPGYTHCVGNKKYGQWQTKQQSGETSWQFHKKHDKLTQAFGLDGFPIINYRFSDYYKNYQERKPYYGNSSKSRYTYTPPTFGTFTKFSENVRRSEGFYGIDRARRVKQFYQNRNYKGTSLSGYIRYPVDDILANTTPDQLPLSVILYDMDIQGSRRLNKYKVITNLDDPKKKQETITPWMRLNKRDFGRNYQNMGMEIASKTLDSSNNAPKVNKVPAPPGYTHYIGNSKYGHWKNRSDGTAFWAFYGKYTFMSNLFNLTTYPVSRNAYSNYRRNYYGRRAYYGGTGTRRRYGTGSPHSRSTSNIEYYKSERATRSRTSYMEYRYSRRSRSGGRSGYHSRSRSGSSGK